MRRHAAVDRGQELVQAKRLGQHPTLPGQELIMQALEQPVVRRTNQHRNKPGLQTGLEPCQPVHPAGVVSEAQVEQDEVGVTARDRGGLQIWGGGEGNAVAFIPEHLVVELKGAHVVFNHEYVRTLAGGATHHAFSLAASPVAARPRSSGVIYYKQM